MTAGKLPYTLLTENDIGGVLRLGDARPHGAVVCELSVEMFLS
jgi:hypothetical protein